MDRRYDVKIIVASHKEYQMPADAMYIPVQVGAAGKEHLQSDKQNYVRDDTGENISELNPFFCELTVLYWAWKNLEADYMGLVHYRRHFSMKRKMGFESVLKYEELKPYLGRIKLFNPKKRRYYIETLYSHYAHTHYSVQLDKTRTIITEKYPQYMDSYDKVLKRTYGHMFNMMIMEKSLFSDYCSWLFDILFELRRRLVMPGLSDFQGRYYGRISEIIFNVWLEQTIVNGTLKRPDIMEIPCIHMERINWKKKGTAFLKAKFAGERYEGSF